MNPPETLTTARLALRRPKPTDAAATYEYGRDPKVTRFMEWPAHTRIEDAIAATEAALRRWETGEEFTWRITLQPDDVPVGAIACRVRDHSARRREDRHVAGRHAPPLGEPTQPARPTRPGLPCLLVDSTIPIATGGGNPRLPTRPREPQSRW